MLRCLAFFENFPLGLKFEIPNKLSVAYIMAWQFKSVNNNKKKINLRPGFGNPQLFTNATHTAKASLSVETQTQIGILCEKMMQDKPTWRLPENTSR